MSSLTTLFVVGPEEYVEFNESLGSKAFLEHVWDESITPLKEGETADSRLRSAGARISSGNDPHIEFPTILRIKGKGNKYKPSGKWISWDELHRQNPLAVSSPPSLEAFKQRGGQVGSGKKLKAGEWLAESKKSAKIGEEKRKEGSFGNGAAESVYAPKNELKSNMPQSDSGLGIGLGLDDRTSSMGQGASESIYAPKPSATPQLREQDGWIGLDSQHAPPAPVRHTPRTSAIPNSTHEQTNSLAAKFKGSESASSSEPIQSTRPERSLFEKFVSDNPSPEIHMAPLPRTYDTGPTTPARRRNVNLHIDPSLPLSSNARSFDSSLASPSTTRTPLSATHPLPETPLKHAHNLTSTPSSTNRGAGLAERRSRAPVTPLSSASRMSADPSGLGLGLTPTRPNTFGGPISPTQHRMPPSRRLSRPLEETLKEVEMERSEEEASADKLEGNARGLAVGMPDPSQSQGTSTSRDATSREPALTKEQQANKAANDIEAMLLRLRSARSGGAASNGSAASRWAVPEASEPTKTRQETSSSSTVVPPTPALGSNDNEEGFGDHKVKSTSGAGTGASLLSRMSDFPPKPKPKADPPPTATNLPHSDGPTKSKKPTAKEKREMAKEKKKQQQQEQQQQKASSTSSGVAKGAGNNSSRNVSGTGSAFTEQFSVKSSIEHMAPPSQPSAMSLAPPSAPTEPRAMRRGSSTSSRGTDARRPSTVSNTSDHSNQPRARRQSTSPAPAARVSNDAPTQSLQESALATASAALVSPSATEVDQANESTASVETVDASAAPAVGDESIVAHPSHSRDNSRFDWAADDEDDDQLPDLDDWGITLPPPSSSSTPSMPSNAAPPPSFPTSSSSSSSVAPSQNANKQTAPQQRVPYWERAGASTRQNEAPTRRGGQQPARELFPSGANGSGGTQGKREPGKEVNHLGQANGNGASRAAPRELFPDTAKPSTSSQPSSGSNRNGNTGLRIAGLAEANAKKESTSSDADTGPKGAKRELLAGTVYSMHAPGPDEQVESQPAKRGGGSKPRGPSSARERGAFGRLTGGIVGASGAGSRGEAGSKDGDKTSNAGGTTNGRGGLNGGSGKHKKNHQKKGRATVE